MIYRKTKRDGRSRTGAAVVEFAVCLPVILLVVMGSIEASNLLFLRQTLVQASYEGAKVAIRDGSPAEVEDAIRAVTDGRNIEQLTIEFIPTNFADIPSGEIVTIRTSAPGDRNSSLPFGPFRNLEVSAFASMVKE